MANHLGKVTLVVALGAWALVQSTNSGFALAQHSGEASSALERWESQEYAGLRYVGSRTCAKCHTAEASAQGNTPMGQALQRAESCRILRAEPALTFRHGRYSFRIDLQRDASIYSVTDGSKTISEALLYCFGDGSVGQTYVFRHDGALYESRVSYYKTTGRLDITAGEPRAESSSLEDALGRRIGADEALSCFACHSTDAARGGALETDSLTPGVSCERCHGPGSEHVAAVTAKNYSESRIFNPGRLDGISLSQEFCGACHRSFDQTMLMPGQGGLNNIRFQSYRLFNSAGHNTLDSRISCIACHDPHRPLVQDSASYDSKCLACHLSGRSEIKTSSRAAPACTVAKQDCVSCHMPKVELPEMHFKFTDHWIRIVRPNERVPR